MSIYHTASMIGLFLIQYATMRFIGVRRRRAGAATDGELAGAQA